MMKTLNDYMSMNYRMEIVEDKNEGGFVISYPELPGCITCGETVETAVENALDAKSMDRSRYGGWNQNSRTGKFRRLFRPVQVENPRSLHRSLAEHSKREGISMNQYCVYLLSRNDAIHSKQKQALRLSNGKAVEPVYI